MHRSQHAISKKSILKIVLAILALILISGTAYGSWRIWKDIPEIQDYELDQSLIEHRKLADSQEQQGISSWKTYRNDEYGYEIRYPAIWDYQEEQDSISFFPPGAEEKMITYYDYHPPVRIIHRENPRGLNLKAFYDGLNAPNLFTDALRGYSDIQIAGREAVKFKGVVGMEESTIVVIPAAENAIIEIWDYGERYQKNRVFDRILYSFSLIE